ncbi:hypothetical protein AVEN_8164-1 [Araneus ventricosus]|uniref:Integrase zinc-binding domain-containing protein n=1 Tax=Araneus ventricosus TaxID=182803 RepID=A0A4Y2K6A1_ARAVE|nr:hypothetical protein AVEN_8164-1 [Araneus ventricosus]
MEEHKFKGYIGVSHVLNTLRIRFWILAGRRVVSSVLKTCKRYSSKNVNPPAPPLPGDRVQDASVFQITGIDYAGPILLREYQNAWICLLTYAVYRCVHLELVTSSTTDTFLQAFHRFVARRGTDGESRRVRLKVQNGEVIRAVQNLYPLEISSTEELPSKFNQNCR